MNRPRDTGILRVASIAPGDSPIEPTAVPAPIPVRFEVLEELDASTGARLVRARDTLLQREVFLELPGISTQGSSDDAPSRERRLREARARARIDHPSVQRLLEVIDVAGGPLLVLEPATGETLASRLAREGRMTPGDVIALGIAVARALEFVHAADVLHRGIDASGILLGEGGRVTLTGFGFAKPIAGDGSAAPSTLVLSSGAVGAVRPAHPAPEQLTLRQDGPRADLFGLGWVLFESLTGARPYAGVNPLEWTHAPDACSFVPQAPRQLARILALCLSPSPAKRPADAAALRRALEAARGGAIPAASRATASPGRTPSRRRLWSGIAVAAAVIEAFLLLGGWPARGGAGESRGREQSGEAGVGHASVPGDAGRRYSNEYAHSRALLIGIGEGYAAWHSDKVQKLAKPKGDVERVAKALADEKRFRWPVENIKTLVDGQATWRNIVNALCDIVRESKPDDRILIYYAGHGMLNPAADDIGYLIPAPGTRDEPEMDAATGLPREAELLPLYRFAEVFKERGRAKHILVVLDCCFGGVLAKDVRSVGLTTSGGETAPDRLCDRWLTSPALVVITAGRGDQTVRDDSPLCEAFVTELAKGKPVTSNELAVAIEHQCLEWKVAQKPLIEWAEGPDGKVARGEFVFFGSK